MEQYRDLFVAEAREHCAEIERDLLALESDPSTGEPLHDLFRRAHTIKGMAATVGYDKIAELAHLAESVLDAVRKGVRPLDRALLDLLLAWRDRIQSAIEAVAAGAPLPDVGDLVLRLEAATKAPPERTATGDAAYRVRILLSPHAPLKAARTVILLRTIGLLGHLVSSDPPLERVLQGFAPDAITAHLETGRSPVEVQTRLAGQLDVAEVTVEPLAAVPVVEPAPATRAEAPPAPGAPAPAPPAATGRALSTIRVTTEQLDTIVDAVGELVVNKARLTALGRRLEDPGLSEALDRMERLTTDLYEHVLKTRMLPLSVVYDRFPRLVRDLAAKLGKDVELVVVGAEIELDRTVIEGLADSLLHVLRNAMDHGIEIPAAREAQGKPARGTIRIEARREHNRVVIEVTDDGRGIDLDRVRRKAIERGLLTSSEAGSLSANDTYLLLCRPGFSTAETATDTSGRGVGLDVVKTWVETLGGSFRIASEPGLGTTMTLRVPLTLAIQAALLVSVNGERFALPLDVVDALVDLQEVGIRTMHGREVIRQGDRVIPVLRLGALLHVKDAGPGRFAVIVEKHGREAALAVDMVLGREDVVVKNLDRRYVAGRELGGVTVLGDGKVALILDVGGLLELNRQG